jgi:hypothetical protein
MRWSVLEPGQHKIGWHLNHRQNRPHPMLDGWIGWPRGQLKLTHQQFVKPVCEALTQPANMVCLT